MSGEKVNFVPPHNYEAEAAILGSVLIDKEAVFKVTDFLIAEDFYRENHSDIYSAVLSLIDKHEPIDILSLANRLTEAGKLEKIGGQTYLGQLAEAVPTASHIVHYATIVQKNATLRRLISASQEITHLSFNNAEGEVDKILDQAERLLFSVSQKYIKRNFVPIGSVVSEAFERIDQLHREKGKLRGIPTGFRALDDLLAGLQPADLVILAARPSVGKTSLALDICRNVAIRAKKAVGVFSLEMSKEQLVDRMICAEANVDLWKMRTGRLSDRPEDNDFPNIGHAIGLLSEAPIYIDDSATANIMEIRTKVRRLQKEVGELGLVIIDYLQLMEGRSNDNRVQEVSEISRSLKGLARELNIPVIALSQLNRGVESRSPQIPRLFDLRESGSIEQDADVVMFLYREDREKPDTPNKNVIQVIVSKHRNGPLGTANLYFNDAITSFSSLEKKHVS